MRLLDDLEYRRFSLKRASQKISLSGDYLIENTVGQLFYVYKALGPKPQKNWSWRPVFASASAKDCESWIEATEYKDTPEAILARRKRVEDERKATLAVHKQAHERGFTLYRAEDETFFNVVTRQRLPIQAFYAPQAQSGGAA